MPASENQCEIRYPEPKMPEPRDPWMHRSEGMRCSSCMWFVEKHALHMRVNAIGRCRRHAPTMNGYPVVFASDWCGDHKLDESK
jgi:hypothetical protein